MTAKEIIQKHARNNGDYIPDYEFPALEEAMNKYANERILSVAREAVEESTPTNWLDPLLTGKDRVVSEASDCREIEALLNAVKQCILSRIEKLTEDE